MIAHSSPPRHDGRVQPDDTSETFWERTYRAKTRPSGGKVSETLAHFVAGRPAGRALELGCARGDDAIWLALNGWHVTAADISCTALDAAKASAHEAGVSDRTDFQQHDLSVTLPAGRFNLVTAMFFQSPVEFPRAEVLRRASELLQSEGLLLIVTHGSRPPWSWAAPDTQFPSAESELDKLKLDLTQWDRVFVGTRSRLAKGPDGQEGQVLDTVLALQRR